jgi:DNA-binding transcriptional LysR family regulator
MGSFLSGFSNRRVVRRDLFVPGTVRSRQTVSSHRPLARIAWVAEHREVTLNWDDLRFLLALRREGSLGAAARFLKVEPSTASRRLSALETALGAKLAARTPEGLVLNEAGLLASGLAETIDRGVDELRGRIGGEDQRAEGTVRLTTTESLATFLMRGLVSLRETYPKIQVELVVSSVSLDLMRREADIAVRGFRETNPTLVARKLSDIGWAVFASREYVDRKRIVPGPDVALADLAVVGYKDPVTRAPGPMWLSANTRPEQVVLAGDSVAAVLNAVRAGLGISALPCFVAAEEPGLVRLTPAVVANGEVFVVIPPDHRDTRRVRLVMDALVELFERERARMEGTP